MRVEVRLSGGLGNQLFEYFAGLLLTNGDYSKVVLNYSRTMFIHDRIGIRALDHGVAELRDRLPTAGRVPALDSRWMDWWGRVRRLNRSEEAAHIESVSEFTRVQGSAIGQGMILEGDVVFGPIPSLAREQGISTEMRLRSPTKWFERLAREAGEKRPIMVHVRRGDYKSNPQWGLLAADYYKRAFEALELSHGDAVWIFSDAPDEADRVVPVPRSTEKVVVRAPKESPAAETMLLMALGRGLVIANSTLSWWSGQITDGAVAAPTPFYRWIPDEGCLTKPELLSLSPNWIPVNAVWSS